MINLNAKKRLKSLLLAMTFSIISSCSSSQFTTKNDERSLANSNFVCTVKYLNNNYMFSPSLLKLEVNKYSSSNETIFLKEDSLIPGGFVYIPETASSLKSKIIRLNFMTNISASPSMIIEFKDHLSGQINVINEKCLN